MSMQLEPWIIPCMIGLVGLAGFNPTQAATFELTATADAEQIVVGEPIYISISARNISEEPVNFAIQSPEIYMSHRTEGFKQVPFESFKLSSGPGVKVEPGDTVSTSVLLSRRYSRIAERRTSTSLFDKAGPYQLKWANSYSLTQTMSNTVKIQVVRGDEEDVKSRQIYTHDTMTKWFDFRNGNTDGQLRRLNWMIERYPTSAFVDHAHVRLAEYFETKSPSQMLSGVESDDDNVWLLPEVKRWLTGRILYHYLIVSDRHPKLQARAYYAAGLCVVNHWQWLPKDFGVDGLLQELDERADESGQLALQPFSASKIRSLIREYQQQEDKLRELGLQTK